MTSYIPPAVFFLLGSAVIPLLKGKARQAFIVLLPCLAFLNLFLLPKGTGWTTNFLDYKLVLLRVDELSWAFGLVFIIMALAGGIFSLREKDALQPAAAYAYVGSALGAVFAGDFLTLFIFWEIMAISSVCLVCARRNKTSGGAAFRYIMVHLFGGLLLMSGILIHFYQVGSLEFTYVGLSGLASWLILLGFAVNAAIPPLSAWLTDAYPESTAIGTVFLSAYTTKTAVYTLARGFPGTEILVWAGIIMVIYGIVFAILENDMRKILSYSIINQVGFMVVGIGIGTAMAVNGAVAHAFAHILYKGLLMMSAGAVFYMTGRSKCTELGGLYKTMPITLIFGLIGAASISAFPWTSGFVAKSLINSAAGHEHMVVIWLLLVLASAGVFLHAGIKFPYFVFFAKDSGLRPKEPPVNMLAGMSIPAFICIFLGVFPQVLYGILPHQVDYTPYTLSHVVNQFQLLMFSALAFFVLLKYLKRTETITLDTDWIYRKAGPAVVSRLAVPVAGINTWLGRVVLEDLPGFLIWFGKNPSVAFKMTWDKIACSFVQGDRKQELLEQLRGEREKYPDYALRPWSIGSAVSSVLLFFLIYLLLYNI